MDGQGFEFPGRRKLTDIATGISQIFDVVRNEGNVGQAGDPFSAENMNGLEQRIGRHLRIMRPR